jgi:hypothetical protein
MINIHASPNSPQPTEPTEPTEPITLLLCRPGYIMPYKDMRGCSRVSAAWGSVQHLGHHPGILRNSQCLIQGSRGHAGRARRLCMSENLGGW